MIESVTWQSKNVLARLAGIEPEGCDPMARFQVV
jgi:hypothetical protein